MDEEQVWAQMSLKIENVCGMLGVLLEGDDDVGQDEVGKTSDSSAAFIYDQMQDASGENMDVDEEGDPLGSDEDSEDSEDGEGLGTGDWDEESELNESMMELRDTSDDESLPEDTGSDPVQSRPRLKGDLHDGFFDLPTFNAETEQAEAKASSAGQLADSDGSDDESLDLFAPVSIGDDSDIETPTDNGIFEH